jgi:hypothetical protein
MLITPTPDTNLVLSYHFPVRPSLPRRHYSSSEKEQTC